MPPPTKRGILARTALADPEFAALNKTQMARVLMQRHPGVFPSWEALRRMLKHLTNAGSNKSRSHRNRAPIAGGKFFQPPRAIENPWAGFPPCLREYPWRVIPITSPLTAVVCDIHFPFYEPEPFLAAMRDLEERQPDCILVLGDLLDFYDISDFRRDPSVETLRQTLKMGYDFFRRLRRRFPKARIIWRYGNHEVRWEHFFWSKAPEFCRQLPKIKELDWVMNHPSLFLTGPSDEELDPAVLADEEAAARALDIEVVKDPVPFAIGKLYLMHGNELLRGQSTTVNTARTATLKAMECIMVGHSHQRSEQSDMSLGGRVISGWSVPCLCQLHPRYSVHSPRWSHGHAFVRYEGGDNFHVTLRRIIKGKVY